MAIRCNGQAEIADKFDYGHLADSVFGDGAFTAAIKVYFHAMPIIGLLLNFFRQSDGSTTGFRMVVNRSSTKVTCITYGGDTSTMTGSTAIVASTWYDLLMTVNKDRAGSLDTRSTDTTGILGMDDVIHGFTTDQTLTIEWGGGSRTGVVVDSVSGQDITFSGGSGDNLPSETTSITVKGNTSFFQDGVFDVTNEDRQIVLGGFEDCKIGGTDISGGAAGANFVFGHATIWSTILTAAQITAYGTGDGDTGKDPRSIAPGNVTFYVSGESPTGHDDAGDIAPTVTYIDLTGTVVVKVDASNGTIDLYDDKNGLSDWHTVDLDWDAGASTRTGMRITSVNDSTIVMTGGSGSDFPVFSTVINVVPVSVTPENAKWVEERPLIDALVFRLAGFSQDAGAVTQKFQLHSGLVADTMTVEVDTDSTFGDATGDNQLKTSDVLGSSTDYTAVLTFSGLKPKTLYYWRAKIGSVVIVSSEMSFTTVRGYADTDTFKFAAFSCLKRESSGKLHSYNTLKNMVSQGIDFAMCIDDLIYTSGFTPNSWANGATLGDLHPWGLKYAENLSLHHRLRDFTQKIPTHMLFGDHEYRDDFDAHDRLHQFVSSSQSAEYSWISQPNNEWYLQETLGSKNPFKVADSPANLLDNPNVCWIGLGLLTIQQRSQGAYGSLSQDEWDFADPGSGFGNTLIVRMFNDRNPNDQSVVSIDQDTTPVPRYKNAWDAYEYWVQKGNPPRIPTSGDGQYYSWTYGRLAFFMLDERNMRSANNKVGIDQPSHTPPMRLTTSSAKDILGAAQEADLAAWRAAHPNHLKIICSPSALHDSSKNQNDSLSIRFSQALADLKATFLTWSNCIFISGNQHFCTAARFDTTPGANEVDNGWEFCASPAGSDFLAKDTASSEFPTPLGDGAGYYHDDDTDNTSFVYMLFTVTFIGVKPTIDVDFVQEDGTVIYSSVSLPYVGDPLLFVSPPAASVYFRRRRTV